jgi:U3 small nucleolar RNA-associated protein 21
MALTTSCLVERFFSYMISLSPAAADMEIRMLTDLQAMRAFLMALTRRLTYHRDFEAVQAFMTIFLRIHGDRIIDDRELRESLEKLLELQRGERDRLVDLISSSLGTLAFVRKGP